MGAELFYHRLMPQMHPVEMAKGYAGRHLQRLKKVGNMLHSENLLVAIAK